LVECPEAKGAINVCSGNAYSVHDVLEMVSEISGHTLEVAVNPNFVRAGEVELLSVCATPCAGCWARARPEGCVFRLCV